MLRNMRNHLRPLLTAALSTVAGSLLLLSAATPVHADSVDDKGDRFLLKRVREDSAGTGQAQAIVQVNASLDTLKRNEIASLGTILKEIPSMNLVVVRIGHGKVRQLTDKSYVRRVSVDVPVKKQDEFTYENSGGRAAFEQYGVTGAGITVAVVDTGIRPHQDFTDPATGASRIVKVVNFASDGVVGSDPNGHGTHVAGILAGNGAASTGSQFFRTFYGVARRAKLVDVRVLDAQGQGTVSQVISGIDWVVNNRALYGIRVLNLSLGHLPGESYKTDPLCLAVERAWKSGIVVICAAGNQGRRYDTADPLLRDNEGFGTYRGTINSPGNSPYCITVGAMKQGTGGRAYDRISTFSSRGPTMLDHLMKPDLVAPGNRVIATKANASYLDANFSATNEVKWAEYRTTSNDNESNKYFRLSGTSMAAPVVSGAAALLLERAAGSLSPDSVKARLMASADRWAHPDGKYDPCTFGAGYLNIPRALNSPLVATRYAVSPALYRDAAGNVRVDMSTILWGETVIWGMGGVSSSTILWGENVVPDPVLPPPLDDTIIWGSTILWGDTILWGNTILWGEDAITNVESLSIHGDPDQ